LHLNIFEQPAKINGSKTFRTLIFLSVTPVKTGVQHVGCAVRTVLIFPASIVSAFIPKKLLDSGLRRNDYLNIYT